MQIKTKTTINLVTEEVEAIGKVVDILNEVMEHFPDDTETICLKSVYSENCDEYSFSTIDRVTTFLHDIIS